MKTFLQGAFILALTLLSGTPIAQGVQANDAVGTIYETAVRTLLQDKVIEGYSDGSIRPSDTISRAEGIKAIVSALPNAHSEVEWFRSHPSPLPLFADMQSDNWFAPYVEVAYKHGIVTGYAENQLMPHASMTAVEAIAMIVRAFNPEVTAGNLDALSSASIENQSNMWFTPLINTAIRKNILMHGVQMWPDAPVNRGQVFDMIMRIREASRMKDGVYAGLEPVMVARVQNSAMAAGASRQDFIDPSLTDKVIAASVSANSQRQPLSPDEEKYRSKKDFAITIPRLGINDLLVSDPKDAKSAKGVLEPLSVGAGHLFAYPGQAGKNMIYGHSSGYLWDKSKYKNIFRSLNLLQPGDKIYITFKGELYIYEVTGHQIVSAKDTKPYKPETTQEKLILYTCWPPDSIAERYLQFAKRIR